MNLIKITLFFIFINCLWGCQQGTKGIQIKDINNLNPHSKELTTHFDDLVGFESIQNKSNYRFVEEPNSKQSYVEGEGQDAEGNHVIFRSNCTTDQSGEYLVLVMGSTGESCSGNNCSKCSFAIEGGCNCNKTAPPNEGSAYCNHTIAK